MSLSPLPNRMDAQTYELEFDVPDSIKLNLFNENNPDIQYFNKMDQEIIELGGSDMYYIKWYQSDNYDKLFEEDREKLYGPEKILLRGHYPPIPLNQEMSKFGVNFGNDQQFTFNKDYLLKKLGCEPKPGDIIQPRFQNVYFEIKEVQDQGFQVYGVYHLVLSAQLKKDVEPIMKELKVGV